MLLPDAVATTDDLQDGVEVDQVHDDDVVAVLLEVVGLRGRPRRADQDYNAVILGIVKAVGKRTTLLRTLPSTNPRGLETEDVVQGLYKLYRRRLVVVNKELLILRL